MGETIYIHRESTDGFGVLFTKDTTVIHTGLEIQTERDAPMLAEISRLCGVDFFLEGQVPDVPLYGVPYLWVFASDGQGGWLAGTQDWKDGPVYHIGPDRAVRLVVEHFSKLFDLMVLDPDWREAHFSGGPWPRLPEAPAGRQKLAETFHLPTPPPEELRVPDIPPRVFSSREEAEKEFSILDFWTVLRQKKEPRFQIHSMMSPQDREGRAFVHYTAWQETYTGLMPEAALAAHTLEHCRKLANDSRASNSTNTFVALDRENDDRVVGFATFSDHARDFVSVPEAGEIVALYMLQEFQGLGLGKQLLEHCLAWFHRPRAALFVLEGSEKAIGFYEHMGFRLTGHVLHSETKGGTLTELEMVLERTTI